MRPYVSTMGNTHRLGHKLETATIGPITNRLLLFTSQLNHSHSRSIRHAHLSFAICHRSTSISLPVIPATFEHASLRRLPTIKSHQNTHKHSKSEIGLSSDTSKPLQVFRGIQSLDEVDASQVVSLQLAAVTMYHSSRNTLQVTSITKSIATVPEPNRGDSSIC